jgi:hypothetical protein
MNEDSPSSPGNRNGESGRIYECAAGVFAAPAPLQPALLCEERERPCYEFKFRIDDRLARELATWAGARLQLDPRADARRGNAYEVHALYLDTPAFDVFQRNPGFRRRKFRVRSYGNGSALYLEQERKSSGRVARRWIGIPAADLERVRAPSIDREWPAYWFHRRIAEQALQPSCWVSYLRQAYLGQSADGPMRMTLDRDLRAQKAAGWTLPLSGGCPFLADEILLELKFRRHLPALFKTMIHDFTLTPEPCSKYRLAVQALGLDALEGRPADA